MKYRLKVSKIKKSRIFFIFICFIIIIPSFMFGTYIAERYKSTIMDYYNKIVVKVEEYYNIISKAIEDNLNLHFELPLK